MSNKLTYVKNASVKGLSELVHTFDYLLYIDGVPVLGVDIHEGRLDQLKALPYILKRIDVGFRTAVIVLRNSVPSKVVELLGSTGVDVITILEPQFTIQSVTRKIVEVSTT